MDNLAGQIVSFNFSFHIFPPNQNGITSMNQTELKYIGIFRRVAYGPVHSIVYTANKVFHCEPNPVSSWHLLQSMSGLKQKPDSTPHVELEICLGRISITSHRSPRISHNQNVGNLSGGESKRYIFLT